MNQFLVMLQFGDHYATSAGDFMPLFLLFIFKGHQRAAF